MKIVKNIVNNVITHFIITVSFLIWSIFLFLMYILLTTLYVLTGQLSFLKVISLAMSKTEGIIKDYCVTDYNVKKIRKEMKRDKKKIKMYKEYLKKESPLK